MNKDQFRYLRDFFDGSGRVVEGFFWRISFKAKGPEAAYLAATRCESDGLNFLEDIKYDFASEGLGKTVGLGEFFRYF